MNYTQSSENMAAIVICDDEEFYACHLQEYLNNNAQITCPVYVYTSTALLLEAQKPEKTRLLIIAESEYREEIDEAGFRAVLILNETSRLLSTQWPDISKYQSIDHILSAILEMAGDMEEGAGQTIRHAGGMHWLGFYSPVSRCLQTSFAMTAGQILGEKHKVLYLNFENWPTLAPLMSAPPEGNISELLYFNDCAREKVSTRLSRIAWKEGNLDLVMPCKDFLQLQKVKAEQWLSLLETIRQVSEYEYLLLDLSESVQGLLEILGRCERIYTIAREDAVGKERMEQYEKLLQEQQVQELAARTRFLTLPLFPELPVKMADYASGPLAVFVRRELEKVET